MSLTSAPAAYNDCYELFARASATPGGVRTPFATETEAKYFQMRMNQSRVIQRDYSRRAYPVGHHLYNTSEYDRFKVQVLADTAGEFWVYVRPHGDWNAVANAEPIPPEEQDALPPLAHDPTPLQLTHQEPIDAESSDLE